MTKRSNTKSKSNPKSPTLQDEIVIDGNGSPRQAGSDLQDGTFIRAIRAKAEQSLYFFCKGILNRGFLTNHFHREICDFIQRTPPYRKLILMPREHAKTAIVSGGLPLHILIQPAESNIYFPGLSGAECRIMLAGETMRMAQKNLRVLEEVHSGNKLFRALWPQRVWDNPRKQAKVWNQDALIFPRSNEWPDPTVWAVGVGTAVTGCRPNVQIKDDLVTFDAANSDIVMAQAIEWHKASRALFDSYEVTSGLKSLEFIVGTRWAVYDLYSEIIDNDPTVEVNDEKYHSIIRDCKILWPEKNTLEDIENLRRAHGSLFYLMYMNTAADASLLDFNLDQVREFKLSGKNLLFEPSPRDGWLLEELTAQRPEVSAPVQNRHGQRMDRETMIEMERRREFSSWKFN